MVSLAVVIGCRVGVGFGYGVVWCGVSDMGFGGVVFWRPGVVRSVWWFFGMGSI